ncbi:MAG: homocysteine biosynthesis protein [bacterium]
MRFKSFDEINRKIRSGSAVVLTAREVTKLARTKSASEIAKTVDVVTTATFSPMCSSGVFLNFGNCHPPIRMENVRLNNVSAYAGLAAVDAYIGATQLSENKPDYGGAHVIEELIAGKDILLEAESSGTDCYPRRKIKALINKHSINEAIMFNPRNCYQNYPVAVNSSNQKKYTYMGILEPNLSNANYCTSGELSPLINDPYLQTIGIGTRIFLGGAQGFISWNGTQFCSGHQRNKFGIPLMNAATLAVTADLKNMSAEFIQAAYFKHYGVSLYVGLGIPIPILDEEIAAQVIISNQQIPVPVVDFGQPDHPVIAYVSYKELTAETIKLNGINIPTSSISSSYKAGYIAGVLKHQILENKFTLSRPVQLLPPKESLNSLNPIVEMPEQIFETEPEILLNENLSFNFSKCIHCGLCINACPSAVFQFNSEGILSYDQTRCTGCFKCVEICPLKLFRSVKVNYEKFKTVPLSG